MEQNNHSTKIRKGKHLTYEKRIKIEDLIIKPCGFYDGKASYSNLKNYLKSSERRADISKVFFACGLKSLTDVDILYLVLLLSKEIFALWVRSFDSTDH